VTDLIDYSQVYSKLSIEQKNGYNKLIGISSGILSTIFVSLTYIILRMANKVHSAVVVFNMGWVALIELFLLSLVLNKFSLPSEPYQWLLIGLLAVFSYAGQIFLTKSLQLEHCSPIAVIRATVDILLSFLWQILIFREDKLDVWSISGGLIITFCIILTTFRKYILSLPEYSEIKLKFDFIIK